MLLWLTVVCLTFACRSRACRVSCTSVCRYYCTAQLLGVTCKCSMPVWLCRWCPELRAVRLHTSDPEERKRIKKHVRRFEQGLCITTAAHCTFFVTAVCSSWW